MGRKLFGPFNRNRVLALDLKEFDPSTGRIVGYGSVFGNVDYGGDVIAPGAFTQTIARRAGKPLPMLWQHYTDEPIGVWTELAEDAHGLRCLGQLDLDLGAWGGPLNPIAWRARSCAQQGSVTGLSIGYDPEKTSNDMIDDRNVRIIEVCGLFEISLVTLPMNEEAQIEAAKSADERLALRVLQLTRRGLDFHEAMRLAQHSDPQDTLDEPGDDGDLERRIRALAR